MEKHSFKGNLKKIIKLVKKVVKKSTFFGLDSLDRGIKVGKKIIGSLWGDMGVRTWNFENYQKTQLVKGMLKTFHIAIKLSKSSTIINKNCPFETQESVFLK
jgi:hypothetical protein